jgi:hypothetical protein
VTQFSITWIDNFREPQCAPDPDYPNGVDIPSPFGDEKPACKTMLPYPAQRCGYYLVVCETCKSNALITTAGRPDDPRSATIPCRSEGATKQ